MISYYVISIVICMVSSTCPRRWGDFDFEKLKVLGVRGFYSLYRGKVHMASSDNGNQKWRRQFISKHILYCNIYFFSTEVTIMLTFPKNKVFIFVSFLKRHNIINSSPGDLDLKF